MAGLNDKGDRELQLRATLRLTLADGVGAVIFRRLVESFGEVMAVPTTLPSVLQNVKGVGPKTAAAIAAVTDDMVEQELAESARLGARILLPDDDDYPPSLRNLYDRPAVLYVRGQIQKTDALAVGIVGSRRCTVYGMEQSERFGSLLGQAGFTVVSGGAWCTVRRSAA